MTKINNSIKNLIKKLQECSTLGQADPILTELNAGPAVKKLVETALILNNSQDHAQRSHAFTFMETAIKELEGDDKDKLEEESPMGQHSHEDGLTSPKIGGGGDGTVSEEEEKDKDKETHGENKIHEEELSNHNQGPRTDGSEQSTDNTQPYTGEGVDSADGEKDMQKMDGTVNQWNETGGMPPPPGGAPPQQGGMPPAPGGMPPAQMAAPPMPGMMPGLAPDIAQEMGMGMPAPPPLDTSQQMRQMQYTIKSIMDDYHRKVSLPMNDRLNATIKYQREALTKQSTMLNQQRDAIKTLSQEIQETKAASGNLKFDLDYMRKNANATYRDGSITTNPLTETNPFFESHGISPVQPINNRAQTLADARSEIDAMDKMLKSGKKSFYK